MVRVLRSLPAAVGVVRGGSHLVEWMGTSGGFIQYGSRGPAVDLLPQQAVEWLINCRNPAAQGWVFVGRWLSLDQARRRGDNGDRCAQLVAAVEDTFAALFPLWATIYTSERRLASHGLRRSRLHSSAFRGRSPVRLRSVLNDGCRTDVFDSSRALESAGPGSRELEPRIRERPA